MEVKIDTKEKFNVATPIIEQLNDNTAEELNSILKSLPDESVKNLIVNLEHVNGISNNVPDIWGKLYESFLEDNASLVFCNMNDQIKKVVDTEELLDSLNVVPTESEAWDIVQMEEMEREMFGSNDQENL